MSLPYFRLYPTDYEAKTSHLSILEDGAYSRLLRLCWMTPGCSLPDDEDWIMRRMRARTPDEISAVKLVLSEYFLRDKQRVYSKRLSEEFEYSTARHDAASKNGQKGGRPAKRLKEIDKDKSYRLADGKLKKSNQNQNQNQNQNHIIPPTPKGDFDAFWQVCPRKIGKDAARRAYAKAVKSADPDLIQSAMAAFAKSQAQTEMQFIPHPATWLNAGRWQDDTAAVQVAAKSQVPSDGDQRMLRGQRQTYSAGIGTWVNSYD